MAIRSAGLPTLRRLAHPAGAPNAPGNGPAYRDGVDPVLAREVRRMRVLGTIVIWVGLAALLVSLTLLGYLAMLDMPTGMSAAGRIVAPEALALPALSLGIVVTGALMRTTSRMWSDPSPR